MTTTRILIPIGAFLLASAIVLLATFLPWIPEWELFQIITAAMGILGAAVAAGLLLRGIWLQTRTRMQQGSRVVLVLMTGFVTFGALLFSSAMTTFILNRGFFEPILKQKFEFPEYSTTVYVYDSSFFDPETTFKLRHGSLPFAFEAGRFPGYDPDHLTVEQEGEYAVYGDFKVFLPTGEIVN
jgi:hypothetical protein